MRTPPSAPRRPRTVIEHGDAFVDDFAWLRDRDDPATRAYLDAENAHAEEWFAPIAPLADTLYHEMLGRIRETDLSVPVRRDGWWYYSRTEEGKQYPIYCRKHGTMDADEIILIDVNLLAIGQSFMAIGDFAVSDDTRLLAYSTDQTGYRQYTLVIRDLEHETLVDFARERVTSVAWTRDNRSLYYTIEDDITKRSWQLWHHRLGDAADTLVYEEHDEAFSVHVARTRSREWLVLQSASHTTSEARVAPAAEGGGEWRVVLPRFADVEYDLDHDGTDFLIRINDTGRNFRLVRAPIGDVRIETFVEVIPARDDVMLEDHQCFADWLIVSERARGVPELVVYRGTEAPYTIEFPEPVREAYLHSNPEWDVDNVRIGYQSLVTPSSVYAFDLRTRERVLLKQQEVQGGYDASAYVSQRVEATATDGTRVPISLVRRRDSAVPGPCLLQGYGSYGYPYPVAFSSNRLSLLDRGFACAIAHIRGGGELGKGWHDAGRMARKKNTFTDFVAAAEALIAAGVTTSAQLAIEGGSAGGLLMGATVNLRPDLFGAVISQVPFVDVINTMSDATLPLTVGEYEEWGNPAVPEEFAWMRAYDPYRNLRAAAYPPMLVRTSLNDSQVMFWEPAKYVARLRTLATGGAPLLFLTNMGAGHGGASGRYDRLREIAQDYAFLLATVGRDPGQA